MHYKQQVVYGLCLVALVLQISAISTENWSVHKEAGEDVNIGLWKMCNRVGGSQRKCIHLPPSNNDSFPKNRLYAVRVFSIMGAVLLFLAMLSVYYKSYKKLHLAMLISSGLSSLVACAIWIDTIVPGEVLKVGDIGKFKMVNPGYSFYLNLAGGVLALAAVGSRLMK